MNAKQRKAKLAKARQHSGHTQHVGMKMDWGHKPIINDNPPVGVNTARKSIRELNADYPAQKANTGHKPTMVVSITPSVKTPTKRSPAYLVMIIIAMVTLGLLFLIAP